MAENASHGTIKEEKKLTREIRDTPKHVSLHNLIPSNRPLTKKELDKKVDNLKKMKEEQEEEEKSNKKDE